MIDHNTARAIAMRKSDPGCNCHQCVLARAYLDAVYTLKDCAEAIEAGGERGSDVWEAAAKARAIAGGKP